MGTWLVRAGTMDTATGDAALGVDSVQIVGGTGAGTAHLNIDDVAGAFIYLDGSPTPVSVAGLPSGFAPDDAFTMHHVTACITTDPGSAASLEIAISGLLDETFAAPPNVGDAPPFYTNTTLAGMTLAALSALVGSHALLTLATSGAPVTAETLEQSNVTYDPDFTFNLNGTYTIAASPSTTVTPSTGPVAGGTTVTLTGIGFNATTGVTFDGLAAAFTIVSDTKLTAISPAHAAGAVTIVVAGAGVSVTFTYALTKTLLPPVPRVRAR